MKVQPLRLGLKTTTPGISVLLPQNDPLGRQGNWRSEEGSSQPRGQNRKRNQHANLPRPPLRGTHHTDQTVRLAPRKGYRHWPRTCPSWGPRRRARGARPPPTPGARPRAAPRPRPRGASPPPLPRRAQRPSLRPGRRPPAVAPAGTPCRSSPASTARGLRAGVLGCGRRAARDTLRWAYASGRLASREPPRSPR